MTYEEWLQQNPDRAPLDPRRMLIDAYDAMDNRGPTMTTKRKANRYDQAIAGPLAPSSGWVPAEDPADRRIVRVEPGRVGDIIPAQAAHPAVIQTEHITSADDRARGFVRGWWPAAAVAGILGGIVAVIGFQVPVFSLAVLGWIAGVFLVTWLLGWTVTTAISPDGAAMFGAWQMWRTVREERRQYWQAYREERDR